jgi:hypothetical protein
LAQDLVTEPAFGHEHDIDPAPQALGQPAGKLVETHAGRLGLQGNVDVRDLAETPGPGEGTENHNPLAGDGLGQNLAKLLAHGGAQPLALAQPFVLHLLQQGRHKD